MAKRRKPSKPAATDQQQPSAAAVPTAVPTAATPTAAAVPAAAVPAAVRAVPDGPRLPERLPGEPARWYGRLVEFVFLGPNRSMLQVYKREREKAGKDGSANKKEIATAPGVWTIACQRWDWKTRAEEWDAACMEQRRAAGAAAMRAEIERERRNAIATAELTLDAALHVLAVAKRRIDRMTDREKDKLPLGILPRWIVAACKAADAALNAQAAAIGTAQVLMALEP